MDLLTKKTLTMIVFAIGFISLTACQNTQLASEEATGVTGDSIADPSIAFGTITIGFKF